MKIFKSSNISKNYKNAVLAIGNFDGLHNGHKKVFREAKILAKKLNLKFGVLTFNPLPVMYFNKKIKNFKINNDKQKEEQIKKLGVDFLINQKFNYNFSKKSSDFFIKKVIKRKINPKFLFVSNNFRFGYNRQGNVFQLRSSGKALGFKLVITKPFKYKKKIISSTLIRSLLTSGKLNLANKLLGRNWSINGHVKKGKKVGKKLGFPTCNLDIKNYILAKPGVYGVKVRINNSKKLMKGIANLGYRPTFGGKDVILEVNLFNVKRNLYKKELTVYFQKFVRSEKKFKNKEQLIKQIFKDIRIAKNSFKNKVIL
tara:strand:- start:1827 stop:2765 length:939 start_codon:yes stop_codon:yes gene_type:complete